MKKALFIYNEEARSTEDHKEDIYATLAHNDFIVTPVATKQKGDAEAICKNRAASYEYIFILGETDGS